MLKKWSKVALKSMEKQLKGEKRQIGTKIKNFEYA